MTIPRRRRPPVDPAPKPQPQPDRPKRKPKSKQHNEQQEPVEQQPKSWAEQGGDDG